MIFVRKWQVKLVVGTIIIPVVAFCNPILYSFTLFRQSHKTNDRQC